MLTWGLWMVVALLLLRFALFLPGAAVRPSNGFAAYYTAARLVIERAPAARFYDDAWFRAQIAAHGPAVNDIYHVNPPTTALLLLPLAGLEHTRARLVWTGLGLVLLVAAGGSLLRSLGLGGPWLPAAIAYALVYQPLFANFDNGQAYVVLLALAVAAWLGYRRRSWVSGVCLALLLVLKTAGALLWLLLPIRRRWGILATGILLVSGIGFATLPLFGIDAWTVYLHLLSEFAARPELAATAYQTQVSFFRHLFVPDARFSPAPLIPAAAVGSALSLLGALAVVGVSVYGAWLGARDDVLFGNFVVASVILSPVAADYHYVLLLLPIAVLVAWCREQPARWPWVPLGLAMALIAADLPYRSPQLASGALALLAYPKLYGAWLLWSLGLWASRRRDPSVTEG